MMIKSTLRKLAFLSLCLGLLFAALPAYATTATGTQNPDLTVFISFEPTCVKAGETIVKEYRITNNTTKTLVVDWEWKVTLNGQPYYNYPLRPRDNNKIQIGPGESWGAGPTSSVIYDWEKKGKYEITLSATNRKSTSRATALFEIYETTCSLGT